MRSLDEADIVDAANVGMRHLPRDPHLVAKARQGRLADIPRSQEFQRHGLVEDQVIGPVNLSHAAAADQPENLVPAREYGARREAAFFGGVG